MDTHDFLKMMSDFHDWYRSHSSCSICGSRSCDKPEECDPHALKDQIISAYADEIEERKLTFEEFVEEYEHQFSDSEPETDIESWDSAFLDFHAGQILAKHR